MSFTFEKELPTPEAIRAEYPITDRIAEIKTERAQNHR